MKKNRVLAVIMAVLMMVTLLPSMVFAAAAPQGALDGKLKIKGTIAVKESYAEGGGFDSLFFMNVHKSEEELRETAEKILNDPSCGDVFRVKGFLKKEDGQWLELNATRHEICIQPTKLGQEIMIVIGEKLNKEVIDEYWK